jgi:hypothetical protein
MYDLRHIQLLPLNPHTGHCVSVAQSAHAIAPHDLHCVCVVALRLYCVVDLFRVRLFDILRIFPFLILNYSFLSQKDLNASGIIHISHRKGRKYKNKGFNGRYCRSL